MAPRKAFPVSPKPMHKSEMGKEMSREMSLKLKSKRIKSKLDVDDEDNKPGKRAKGGY